MAGKLLIRSFIFFYAIFLPISLFCQNPVEEEKKQAQEFENNKEYEKAILIYENLHDQDPNNFEYEYQLGKLYFRIKKYILAKEYLNKCIQRYPEHYDARLYLAEVFYQEKDYPKAIEQLDIIIKNVPNYSDALVLRGRIYAIKDDEKMAKKSYLKAIESYPTSSEAWLPLGQLYLQDTKYKKALDSLNKAYNNAPDDENILRLIRAAKPYVRPSVFFEGGAVQERERDLVTFVRSVELDSIIARALLKIPVNDHIRPFFEFSYVPQKQRNLVVNINNYNVYIYKYDLGSDFFFKKYFSAKADFIVKTGRNEGRAGFPFRNRISFEPGALLKYRDNYNLILARYFVDSMIARDFAVLYSYFMRMQEASLLYELKPYKYFGCGVEGKIRFYNSTRQAPESNQRKSGSVWGYLGIPMFYGELIGRYQYDYQRMLNIAFDYMSYLNERTQTYKISFVKNWSCGHEFNMNYTHLWRKYRDLTNEARVVTAALQDPQVLPFHKYEGNQFDANLKIAVGKSFSSTLSSMYYTNTDDYAVWLIKGSLEWVF